MGGTGGAGEGEEAAAGQGVRGGGVGGQGLPPSRTGGSRWAFRDGGGLPESPIRRRPVGDGEVTTRGRAGVSLGPAAARRPGRPTPARPCRSAGGPAPGGAGRARRSRCAPRARGGEEAEAEQRPPGRGGGHGHHGPRRGDDQQQVEAAGPVLAEANGHRSLAGDQSVAMSRRLLATRIAQASAPTATPAATRPGDRSSWTKVVPTTATRPKNTKTLSSPRPR